MLDPREQKKGGFGAHVAREQERHELQKVAKGTAATPDASFAPPAPPEGQSTGPVAGDTTPR